jgi:hypothetical protein
MDVELSPELLERLRFHASNAGSRTEYPADAVLALMGYFRIAQIGEIEIVGPLSVDAQNLLRRAAHHAPKTENDS